MKQMEYNSITNVTSISLVFRFYRFLRALQVLPKEVLATVLFVLNAGI